ncbi:MAG: GAF and ANTAR domain-containing protein [Pseudolysinimonas sp.]
MSDTSTAAELCDLYVDNVPVSGASITVFRNPGTQSTICTSNEIAAQLDELQFDLGEGPRWEAARSGRPTGSDDVSSETHPDWPVFGRAAAELGVGALFSFPIRIGTVLLGVADLYRLTPGALDDAATSRALSISHRVAVPAAETARRSADSPLSEEGRTAPALRREVHQATGMILVQLDVDADVAFGLLKAHAFAQSRSVEDVSHDVVARRIDFRELTREP